MSDAPVTQPGNTDPHARMIDLICDLAGADTSEHNRPNEADTLIEFASRARDILTVFEAQNIKEKWGGAAGYPDEDGDLHSPVWYLDAWMGAHKEYHDTLCKPIDGMTQDEEDAHMRVLDDLLKELDKYEGFVNKLFNYPTE